MQEQDQRFHGNVGDGPFVHRACLYAGQEAKQRLDSLLDVLLPCLPAQESVTLGATDEGLTMIEVATTSRLHTHFVILLIRSSVAAVA